MRRSTFKKLVSAASIASSIVLLALVFIPTCNIPLIILLSISIVIGVGDLLSCE